MAASRYVLFTTVDREPLVVGPFLTDTAAKVAVATLKVTHPEYKGWKVVSMMGIRELKRPQNIAKLQRKAG